MNNESGQRPSERERERCQKSRIVNREKVDDQSQEANEEDIAIVLPSGMI